MIAKTHPVVVLAVKTCVNVRALFGRCMHALAEARMRRIQDEAEFQRLLYASRHANGMPPLSQDDLRAKT